MWNVCLLNTTFSFFFDRYKERLHTKHIKSLKPNDTSKMLVGHNWLFLKDGLDDFRDGLPPPNIGDPVIKVNIVWSALDKWHSTISASPGRSDFQTQRYRAT